jgi:HAMP domain-containing protein
MSLRYRIAVTIFALEAVMIAGVLWVTLNHSLNSTRAQMGYGEWVTLRLLSDLSRMALLTEEYADLQLFIESAREHPRLTAVLLVDSGGRVVAATDAALIGSPVPDLTARPHRHWRTRDVIGASGRLGSLAIEFSEHPLVTALRQAWNLGLGIAVSGMALIAVVGLTMGYLLTRRLERLAESADRVAAGDTTVRVNLPGRDEVARVGRAFDSMVGRLAANLKELEAARDRLIQPTEAMAEGFALWDADDRLVLCNRRYRELFGDLGVPIELGATFDLESFRHLAVWNEAVGRVEMHLESLADQTVRVAGRDFHFVAGETIFTESSYKYSLEGFRALAADAGFRTAKTWLDDQKLFSVHFLVGR